MKNRTTRSAALALFVMALGTTILLNRYDLLGEAKAQSQKSQKWEYCYVTSPFSYGSSDNVSFKVYVSQGGEKSLADSDSTGVAALNKLGAEGWELVSASDELTNPPTVTRFLLKRPKQ